MVLAMKIKDNAVNKYLDKWYIIMSKLRRLGLNVTAFDPGVTASHKLSRHSINIESDFLNILLTHIEDCFPETLDNRAMLKEELAIREEFMKVEEFKSIIISSMKQLCNYSNDCDMELGELVGISVPLLHPDVHFGNESVDVSNPKYDQGGLYGFNSIGDFNFLGCSAGNDNELHVFFILYYDDELKVFVPTVGNYFCNDHMCAYGNCECDFDCSIEFDWTEIKKEITNKFVTKNTVVQSIYNDWTNTKLVNTARKLYNEVFVSKRIIPYDSGIEVTNEEKLINITSELLRRGYSQTVSIDFIKRGKK